MARGFLSRETNHTYKSKPVTMFGCDFRSQLEARWAIVLTELGVPWEFEPRTFRTPEGGYIPDFRALAKKPFWLEIKGPEPLERDYVRAEHVQKQTGEKLRFLVGSIPDGNSGGYLATRILSAGKWRPAHWRTPWPAARLDAALATGRLYSFSPPGNSALLP